MVRTSIVALSFLLGVACALPAAEIDADDLRPGLVTTYEDASRRELVRLEPTMALAKTVCAAIFAFQSISSLTCGSMPATVGLRPSTLVLVTARSVVS